MSPDMVSMRLVRHTAHMPFQPALPFPGADERCPKCGGRGHVYYLHATMPNADVVGGKRVVCPVCLGEGRIMVPVQRKAVVTP
jgi:hypothetical protein